MRDHLISLFLDSLEQRYGSHAVEPVAFQIGAMRAGDPKFCRGDRLRSAASLAGYELATGPGVLLREFGEVLANKKLESWTPLRIHDPLSAKKALLSWFEHCKDILGSSRINQEWEVKNKSLSLSIDYADSMGFADLLEGLLRKWCEKALKKSALSRRDFSDIGASRVRLRLDVAFDKKLEPA